MALSQDNPDDPRAPSRKAPVPLFKFMAKILNTDDLLEIVSYTKGFPNPRRQTPIQELAYA